MKVQSILLTLLTALLVSPPSYNACEDTSKNGNKEAIRGDGDRSHEDPVKEMVGYWAPESESIERMLTAQLKDAPGPRAMVDKVIVLTVEALNEFFVFHVTDDKVFVLDQNGYTQQSSYKVLATDVDTGDFVVEDIAKGTRKKAESKGNVRGDTMTLSFAGVPLKMKRISEAEFEARKIKASEFDVQKITKELMKERKRSQETAKPAQQ